MHSVDARYFPVLHPAIAGTAPPFDHGPLYAHSSQAETEALIGSVFPSRRFGFHIYGHHQPRRLLLEGFPHAINCFLLVSTSGVVGGPMKGASTHVGGQGNDFEELPSEVAFLRIGYSYDGCG